MKLLLVPLDSRPCNYIFPVQLGNLQNVTVITPPIEVIGTYTTPCNYPQLKAWFVENAPTCDAIVIAMDMLAYGSLLNSRKMDISLEEALNRVTWLEDFHKQYPQIPIYAYNVIMRTTISTLSQDHVIYWKKVNEFCQHLYLAQINNDEQEAQIAEDLRHEIPKELLEQFFFARKRNHEINQYCVSLLEKGVFTQLLLLQEDSTPYGMHKTEQAQLRKRLQQANLEDRCFMHNGTDESGCLMTATAITRQKGIEPTLWYQYASPKTQKFIASYEDRPFHENLLSQIKAAGIQLSDESDMVLYIFNPKKHEIESEIANDKHNIEYTDEELDKIANEIASLIESGKQVGLLDVVCANGGYGKILELLAAKTDIDKLIAYSAWNTASNSLGTILAQMMAYQPQTAQANRMFTFERLLDDYAYQGVIRPRLRDFLTAIGEDPFQLKNPKQIAVKLRELTDEFIQTSPLFAHFHIDYTCTFPWPRVFEATYLVNQVTRKE